MTQLQVVVVGMSWELEMFGGVVRRQSETLQIQWDLIMAIDKEQRRRISSLERRIDLWGQTFGNLIVIDLDEDEVMLVDNLEVMWELVLINNTPDGSDD